MTVAQRQHNLQQERALVRRLHDQYAGMWVAVRDHEVIASADTAEALYEQLAHETAPFRSFRVKRGSGVALLGFSRA